LIFTKFDALDDEAYAELIGEGISHRIAQKEAPLRSVQDFKAQILGQKYPSLPPPERHVYLRGE
jgi:hypothetical protein